MTHTYYEPIQPITSIARDDLGGHWQLRVFLRSKLAGAITVSAMREAYSGKGW